MLPAAVLHDWDFQLRPVCCMAAHYLAATAEQPLLCLEAVNPGLYDAVPSLQQAHRRRQQAFAALHAASLLLPEAGLLVGFIITLYVAQLMLLYQHLLLKRVSGVSLPRWDSLTNLLESLVALVAVLHSAACLCFCQCTREEGQHLYNTNSGGPLWLSRSKCL